MIDLVRVSHLRSCFGPGLPNVLVAPAQWPVPVPVIRRVAAEYGYTEIPPPRPDWLAFRRPLPIGSFGPATSWVPVQPTMLVPPPWPPPRVFDHPPSARPDKRLQWLDNRLSNRQHSWVSLAEAALPRAQVERFAAERGMHPVAALLAESDQLLLLGREPYRPAYRIPGARRPIRPLLLVFLVPVLVLIGMLGAVAVAPTAVLQTVFLYGTLPAVMLASVAIRALPRSARAELLAREFSRGNQSATVLPNVYRFDESLYAQMAALHGYYYARETRTRAQGRFVTFLRVD